VPTVISREDGSVPAQLAIRAAALQQVRDRCAVASTRARASSAVARPSCCVRSGSAVHRCRLEPSTDQTLAPANRT
jgi:hypothetical protein